MSFRRVQALLGPCAKDALSSGQMKSMSTAMSSTLDVFKWSGHVFACWKHWSLTGIKKHMHCTVGRSRLDMIGLYWRLLEDIGSVWKHVASFVYYTFDHLCGSTCHLVALGALFWLWGQVDRTMQSFHVGSGRCLPFHGRNAGTQAIYLLCHLRTILRYPRL